MADEKTEAAASAAEGSTTNDTTSRSSGPRMRVGPSTDVVPPGVPNDRNERAAMLARENDDAHRTAITNDDERRRADRRRALMAEESAGVDVSGRRWASATSE